MKILKESFWLVISQFFTVIGSLLLLKFLTSKLLPSEYGMLALSLTIVSLPNQVFVGGVSNSVARYIILAKKYSSTQYFLDSLFLILRFSILLLFVIFSVLILGLSIFNSNKWLFTLIILFFYTTILGFSSIFNTIQNSIRKRKIVAFHSMLDSLMKLVICFIFLNFFLLFENKVNVILFSFLLSSILTLMSQFYFLRREFTSFEIKLFQSSNSIKKKYWLLSIIKYASPFFIWGLFTWLQIIADKWLIEQYLDVSNVGRYSAVYQLGYTPMILFSTALLTLISPIVFEKFDLKGREQSSRVLYKVTYVYLGIVFIIFFISLIYHSEVLSIFINENFLQTSYLLPWMILSAGIFSTAQFLTLKFLSEINPKKLILVKVSTSIIGIAFVYFGLISFGLLGIVLGMCFYSLFYFFWMLYLIRKS